MDSPPNTIPDEKDAGNDNKPKQKQSGWGVWTLGNIEFRTLPTLVLVFGLGLVALFKLTRSDSQVSYEVIKEAYNNTQSQLKEERESHERRLYSKDSGFAVERKGWDSTRTVLYDKIEKLSGLDGYKRAINDIKK